MPHSLNEPEAPPANLDAADIERLGREIFDAERAATTLDPLSERIPGLTVAQAYDVQRAYARLRMAHGAKLVGRKIGATSKAIQDLFRIYTPDYGHLFDDMRCYEDQPVDRSKLIQPMVETEVAFILAEELAGPGIEPEDVLAASSGVVACIEIIDSRIHDWRIQFVDTVADNGSSARFLIGSEVFPPDAFDLSAEKVVLTRNGQVVAEGSGAAVLGHPANSAAWLANAVGEFGDTLPAGAIVLSGSMTTAVRASAGDHFAARFDHLGSITVSFR